MPTPDLTPLLDQAFARHQAGDLAAAADIYRDILTHYPRQPDALHMLGIIARQRGNNELALKLIEIALGQNPAMALAWHNRSLILRLMGRGDEALNSARQCVDLDPNFAEAWDMIGILLREKKDLESSREAHARAVALRPKDMKFLGNDAQLLLATGDLVKAYEVMREIEANDVDFMPHGMGNVLKAAGYPEKALPYYQKALDLLPDHPEIRTAKAMTHLLIGDFEEGWKIWETRPDLDARFASGPLWRGEEVKHLLLHEDQGLGDALQFARYIPLLKPSAKKLTLQVTKALEKIFRDSFPGIEVLTLDDPVPAADARIRLLSLPAFFAADAANIPVDIPYLRADDAKRQVWRKRFSNLARPRIGIVWSGNPDHLNDKQRSIPFDLLAPLLKAGTGYLISLQKGAQKNEAGLGSAGIYDAALWLEDFSDTAALIAELDLLIAVDTSVVHLAGAMGKPVWLLLPFDPDWRWLLGREASPWYPSLRLFRQKQPRDWSEVIAYVTGQLGRLLAGDGSTTRAKRWTGNSLRQNPQAIPLPFSDS